MGQITISMVILHSELLNYQTQRVGEVHLNHEAHLLQGIMESLDETM